MASNEWAWPGLFGCGAKWEKGKNERWRSAERGGNAHNKPQKDEKTTKDENRGSRARAETTQSHQNDGRQNEISWEQRPHPERRRIYMKFESIIRTVTKEILKSRNE